MKNFIYITVAYMCLGLALVGVMLPVLPTTPFVIAASFFGIRGSERFNDKLKSSNFYSKYVLEYKEIGLTLKRKIAILFMASSMLMLTFFLTQSSLLRTFILILMVIKYSVFIFVIPTGVRHDK